MKYFDEIAPNDGQMHRDNLVLLQKCLTCNSAYELLQQCPAGWFSGLETYVRVDTGPVNPRTTFVYEPLTGQLLVVLNGMSSFDKVATCLDGWSNANGRTPAGTQPPYQQAAQQVGPNAPTTFSQPYTSVWIVGHSYGGAVATYLPLWMPHFREGTRLKIYTYGAPKSGVGNNNGFQPFDAIRRTFLAQDPVPSLPPSSEEFGALWTLTGVPTARQWSRWQQCSTGYSIQSDGSLRPATRPTFNGWGGPIFTLAGWLSGIQAFGSDQHTLNAYQLALAGTPAAERPSTAPRPTGIPSVRVETANEMQIERNIAVAQEMQGVAADPTGTAIGIVTNVPIVPGQRYRGVRASNGDQYVLYGTDIVAVCPTRRVRRAVVRQLNRAIGM